MSGGRARTPGLRGEGPRDAAAQAGIVTCTSRFCAEES